ncbi:hypothetical protein [Rhodoferax sp. U11-2br]|uniref:hypothetical protein n=1 Tax=Rhodoferax sp. U11-2br TaxID=2838878 RepID=UPI001BE83CB6|nr:hypothetical protein [Rhodoferax sp. U11-2br]MBT3065313.1 hypothetical protein [Rhodoferax sp. U11-2br]
MNDLALSPHFLDFILVFTVVEFVVLGLIHQRSGRGLPWLDLGLGLVPGFLLMLAYRVSQPQSLSGPVLLCLALAGLAHGADFYRRYRATRRP